MEERNHPKKLRLDLTEPISVLERKFKPGFPAALQQKSGAMKRVSAVSVKRLGSKYQTSMRTRSNTLNLGYDNDSGSQPNQQYTESNASNNCVSQTQEAEGLSPTSPKTTTIFATPWTQFRKENTLLRLNMESGNKNELAVNPVTAQK